MLTTTIEHGKKVEMTSEEQQVLAFVEAQTVAIDLNRTICVDGRYKPEESLGAIALPGADLGLSMAILALKNSDGIYRFSPDEAFNMVYKYCISKGRPFCWHSDEHAQDSVHEHIHSDSAPVIGCGHCNKAILQASADYGVDGERVSALLAIIQAQTEADKKLDKPTIQKIELKKNHGELAVLVISGQSYTVDHSNPDGQKMFFVYHQTLTENILSELAQVNNLDVNSLLEVFNLQKSATLGLLAPGKSVFSVDFDDNGKVQVKKVATIPSPENKVAN